MRFVREFTIPKHTTEIDPHIETIALVKGTLADVSFGFPPGCASLVHVVICDGLLQIIPITRDNTIHWDGHIERVPITYPLKEIGHQLTIKGWSPNARYDHTVTLAFDVEPKGEESWTAIFERLFKLPTVAK